MEAGSQDASVLQSAAAGLLAMLPGASPAVANCLLGVNFTRPAWEAANDMFTNYTAVTGENPWNPRFVHGVKLFAYEAGPTA